MNLEHYYHLYADGAWKDIADEHITALKTSGLLDALEGGMSVGIVGAQMNRVYALQWLHNKLGKWNFHYVGGQDTGWEQVTLQMLQLRSHLGTNGLVFYAHTKGAAYPGKIQTFWRSCMMKQLVDNWRNVTTMLNVGYYDCAGCFVTAEQFYEPNVKAFVGVHGLSTVRKAVEDASGTVIPWAEETGEPVPQRRRVHFSGNYWWSTYDWIRQLPPVDMKNRHDGEMWIGKGFPNMLDLHPGSVFDLYRNKFNEPHGRVS